MSKMLRLVIVTVATGALAICVWVLGEPGLATWLGVVTLVYVTCEVVAWRRRAVERVGQTPAGQRCPGDVDAHEMGGWFGRVIAGPLGVLCAAAYAATSDWRIVALVCATGVLVACPVLVRRIRRMGAQSLFDQCARGASTRDP